MLEAGSVVMSSLIGIPYFILYFVLGAALMAIFVILYTRITPHDEFGLIQAGNITASLGLAGAMVGFSLPLAKAIAQAVSVVDLLIWALAALVVQLLAYAVTRAMLRELPQMIAEDRLPGGIMLAAGSIACGLLNAAAMSL